MSDDFGDVAGDYVMGLLPAGEAEAARVRIGRDAAFAAEVARWERRLAPLARLVAPVAPPEAVWRRLDRATRPAASYRRTPWIVAAGGYALAAGLAAVLLVRPVPVAAPGPTALTALSPTGAPPAAYIVEREADGKLRLIAIAPVQVASGRDLQLWLLPRGATVPVSLGVLPKGGTEVASPAGVGAGAQLLISLEPGGGSPTGLPTGPVLYGATVSDL